MNLIRFGKQGVNMDQVTHWMFAKKTEYIPYEAYHLYFACIMDGSPDYIEIKGGDMIAFERWLAENSTDMSAPTVKEMVSGLAKQVLEEAENWPKDDETDLRHF